MSILLNALKKSEAQRQVGQSPGIHSPAGTPVVEGEADNLWVPLSMLAVSAVAVVWIGWQQYREPLMTSGTAPIEVSAEAGEGQVVVQSVDSGAGPRTPVESLAEERSGLRAITVMPPASLQRAEARKQELKESFSDYTAEQQAVETAASPDPVPLEQLASAVAKMEVDEVVGEVTETPVPAQTDASNNRSSRLAPHESEPISFWQMPQALRDGLPEIRITVLVYAESPEDRFVLINGVRLIEKEELTSGVVLDEIRRDGAVFRYRNYRFLVKG